MKTSVKWKLIQRYVAGHSSPQERRKLKQWMDQAPANQRLVKEVEEIWELTPQEDFDVNVQDAWERFNHRKMQRSIHYTSASEIQHRFRKTMLFYRAAAVILVMLLAGFFVQYYITTHNSDTEKTTQFYVMQDLTTEKGEKARVTFSDGTQVTLNAASFLQFPKEFHGAKREVYLDGEAYFKVASDPDHPFIVHTRDARVEVLGTEFNVRGWSEDASVDVAVREGKVSVNSTDGPIDHSEVILSAGQFTRVNRGQGPAPAGRVNVENHLLWTRGGLHFDNVPFEQVFHHIEREFDVEITVEDAEVLEVPFTSTFRNTELNKILNVIAASLEMGYSRDESEILFK